MSRRLCRTAQMFCEAFKAPYKFLISLFGIKSVPIFGYTDSLCGVATALPLVSSRATVNQCHIYFRLISICNAIYHIIFCNITIKCFIFTTSMCTFPVSERVICMLSVLDRCKRPQISCKWNTSLAFLWHLYLLYLVRISFFFYYRLSTHVDWNNLNP